MAIPTKIKLNVIMSEQLKKTFLLLPYNLEHRIKRGALRAGAKAMKGLVKGLVPTDRGGLKTTIRHGADTTKDGKVFGYVRAGGKSFKTKSTKITRQTGLGSMQTIRVKEKRKIADGFYAHFVEYGTKAHTIPHERARILSKFTNEKGKLIKTKGIRNPRIIMKTPRGPRMGPFKHPGSTPSPYMRPGFAKGKHTAIAAIADYIAKRLDSAVSQISPIDIDGDE